MSNKISEQMELNKKLNAEFLDSLVAATATAGGGGSGSAGSREYGKRQRDRELKPGDIDVVSSLALFCVSIFYYLSFVCCTFTAASVQTEALWTCVETWQKVWGSLVLL